MNWVLNSLPTYSAIKLDLNAGCPKTGNCEKKICQMYNLGYTINIKNLQFFPDLNFEVYPLLDYLFWVPLGGEISRKYANIPSIGEKNTLPGDYMHI